MVAALAAWLGGAIVRLAGGAGARLDRHARQVIAGASAALAVFGARRACRCRRSDAASCCAIYFAARAACRRDLSVDSRARLVARRRAADRSVRAAGAGAWLSFGAVAIILLAVGGRVRRERRRSRLRARAGAVTSASCRCCSLLSAASRWCRRSRMPSRFRCSRCSSCRSCCSDAVRRSRLGGRPADWVLALPVALLQWIWPLLEWLAERPLALLVFPAACRCRRSSRWSRRAVARPAGNLATRLAGCAAVPADAPVSIPRSRRTVNFELDGARCGAGARCRRAHAGARAGLRRGAGVSHRAGYGRAGGAAVSASSRRARTSTRWWSVTATSIIGAACSRCSRQCRSRDAGGPVGRAAAAGARAVPARTALDVGRRAVRDAASGASGRCAATTIRRASCASQARRQRAADRRYRGRQLSRRSSQPGCRVRRRRRASSRQPHVVDGAVRRRVAPALRADLGRLSQSLGIAAARSRRALARRRRATAHDRRQRRDRDRRSVDGARPRVSREQRKYRRR